jgi:hypothetical protein
MNKTTLFLICLILPISLAQEDILNLIDKTPEGKELLDHLFIQTKLMGNSLDINALGSFLRTNRDRLAAESKVTIALAASEVASCKADKLALGNLLHNHQSRELSLRRQLAAVKRTSKRADNHVERATEELNNYKKFSHFIQNNKAGWNKYYNTYKGSVEASRKIFSRILATTKKMSGASFVELPADYQTSLAQVKMEVESTEFDFLGMGPVVANLMEIMSNSEAMVKPQVVLRVRGLVESIQEAQNEKWEGVEEENEHQSALFEHLEKAFNENVERSNKELDGVKAASDGLARRVAALTAAADHANNLATRTESIRHLRGSECRKLKNGNRFSYVRVGKINAIISQLQDILTTKSSGLKSFFVQREMKRSD